MSEPDAPPSPQQVAHLVVSLIGQRAEECLVPAWNEVRATLPDLPAAAAIGMEIEALRKCGLRLVSQENDDGTRHVVTEILHAIHRIETIDLANVEEPYSAAIRRFVQDWVHHLRALTAPIADRREDPRSPSIGTHRGVSLDELPDVGVAAAQLPSDGGHALDARYVKELADCLTQDFVRQWQQTSERTPYLARRSLDDDGPVGGIMHDLAKHVNEAHQIGQNLLANPAGSTELEELSAHLSQLEQHAKSLDWVIKQTLRTGGPELDESVTLRLFAEEWVTLLRRHILRCRPDLEASAAVFADRAAKFRPGDLDWDWNRMLFACDGLAQQVAEFRTGGFSRAAASLSAARKLFGSCEEKFKALQQALVGAWESRTGREDVAEAALAFVTDLYDVAQRWLNDLAENWPVQKTKSATVVGKFVATRLVPLVDETAKIVDELGSDCAPINEYVDLMSEAGLRFGSIVRATGNASPPPAGYSDVSPPARPDPEMRHLRKPREGQRHAAPRLLNDIGNYKSELVAVLDATSDWIVALENAGWGWLADVVRPATKIPAAIDDFYVVLVRALSPTDDQTDAAMVAGTAFPALEDAAGGFLSRLLELVEPLSENVLACVEPATARDDEVANVVGWLRKWGRPAGHLMESVLEAVEPASGLTAELKDRVAAWAQVIDQASNDVSRSPHFRSDKGKEPADEDDVPTSEAPNGARRGFGDESNKLNPLRLALQEVSRALLSAIKAVIADAQAMEPEDTRVTVLDHWRSAQQLVGSTRTKLSKASASELREAVATVSAALDTLLHGTAGALVSAPGAETTDLRLLISSSSEVQLATSLLLETYNEAAATLGLPGIDGDGLPPFAELLASYRQAHPPVPDDATMARIRQAGTDALKELRDGAQCPYYLRRGPYPLLIVGRHNDPVIRRWRAECDYNQPFGIQRYTATGLHPVRRLKNLFLRGAIRPKGEVLIRNLPDGYEGAVMDQFPLVPGVLLASTAGKDQQLAREVVELPEQFEEFWASPDDGARGRHGDFRRFLVEHDQHLVRDFDFLAAVARFRAAATPLNAQVMRRAWLGSNLTSAPDEVRSAFEEIDEQLSDHAISATVFDAVARLTITNLSDTYLEFRRAPS